MLMVYAAGYYKEMNKRCYCHLNMRRVSFSIAQFSYTENENKQ